MDESHRRQSTIVNPAGARPARGATVIVMSLCAALVVLSAMQLWVTRRAAGEAVAVGGAILFGAVAWLPWAITGPLILAAGRRYDFRRGRRLISAAVHLPMFLLCYAPFTMGLIFLGNRLFGAGGRRVTMAEVLSQAMAGTRMQLGMIVYGAIVGLGLAVRTRQALQERELEASRLEALAARARLEALSARLQPHFLFNTLHAIGALIEEAPARARTMIALLGDLLRDLIAGTAEGEVPLRVELELLRRYLAIEQVRFEDRLQVEIAASLDSLERKVPRLLLQPIAENALRHGLAPRAAAVRLAVVCRLDGDALILEVTNDGLPLASTVHEGVGLATTRERLESRVPAGTLVLRQQGPAVEARITLPARPGEVL